MQRIKLLSEIKQKAKEDNKKIDKQSDKNKDLKDRLETIERFLGLDK